MSVTGNAPCFPSTTITTSISSLLIVPSTAQIKLRSTNGSKPKNTTVKPKSTMTMPTKPAMKPVIQQAPQKRSVARKRRHRIISGGSEVESEDDAAPVSKKGRMDQQRGKGKKTGAQRTPPPPVSEEDNIEEDCTEEDVGDDVDGTAGGQGRKGKSGDEVIPT
ncbi:hypothetical protein EV421DRAFT_1948202 [Armillaria borealis]|uniref:Uncharacterized protein n=1 Tax=Armillaria borealis TaxID=47425 RepID=A0AA39ISC3_9AGAR|nr:hypothetical protein EV421DRAFT_1948202 [Armillaria borealis]